MPNYSATKVSYQSITISCGYFIQMSIKRCKILFASFDLCQTFVGICLNQRLSGGHAKVVTVMLVTSLCWWLYDGDWFEMLVTESFCWRLFSLCWWFSQCIKSVINILNRSPTPQICHQHIWSPTSVTNIDVTRKICVLDFDLRLRGYCFGFDIIFNDFCPKWLFKIWEF